MTKLAWSAGWSLALSVAIAGQTAGPAEPGWQPAGKWFVDFADEQCTAQRTYRSGARELELAFRPRPTSLDVAILIEAPGEARALRFDTARLGLGARMLDDKFLVLNPSKSPGRMVVSSAVGRDELMWLLPAQNLKVLSESLQVDLPVSGLSGVLPVLDRCIADLLAHWGLSQQDQARLAKFPVPVKSAHLYVRSGDYPRDAAIRRAVGQVEARMTVSPEGIPSDCRLVRSSGHSDLDKATCEVMVKRARFSPALDRDGKPMGAPYYFGITWAM